MQVYQTQDRDLGATTLWDPSLPTFKDVETKIIWSPQLLQVADSLLHSAYSNERPD